MFLIDTIDHFISGDWGEETLTAESPKATYCVRGADINNVNAHSFYGTPLRYVARSSFDNKQLQAGDIVIEKSGGSPTQSTGRTAFISQQCIDELQDVVCSNFCAAFRVKENWNSKYVFYYMQHVYNSGVFFNFEGKTSGLRNLQIENAFKSIPIEHIDKPVQDRIVHMLDKIESLIVLKNAINRNLEQVARQLYDYWFVQFDFPNHEGKPYKSSGGEMVWNESLNRFIPKIFERGTLNDYIGRITNGLNPRKNFTLGSGDNYYVTIRSLLGSDIDWDNCDRCDDDALRKINSRSQLQVGDVIFSAIGTIGRTYYIQEEPKNWNISETSFTLRPKENVPNDFFYSLLNCSEIQLQADKNAMGSTLRCLVMESLCKIPYFVVPQIIMELFSAKVKPVYKSIYQNGVSIRHLQQLRDELLPMLLNGQVNCDLSL